MAIFRSHRIQSIRVVRGAIGYLQVTYRVHVVNNESRESGDQAHREPLPRIRLCGDTLFYHPGRIYPSVTLLDHHGIGNHRCEENLLVSVTNNPALIPKLDFHQRNFDHPSSNVGFSSVFLIVRCAHTVYGTGLRYYQGVDGLGHLETGHTTVRRP